MTTQYSYSPKEDTPLMGNGRKASILQESSNSITLTLGLTILAATVGSSLQFGYATGVMNNSEETIRNYFIEQGRQFTLVQWSTTVSSYGVGGLIGALLGPKVIGRFCGRKTTLMINNAFLFASSAFMVFGPSWWYLAIGRILVGIVAGVATAVVPTYLSEIAPVPVRGAVGTLHQLGITVGILIAQTLSTPSLHLLGSKDRWQWLFFVPVLCGLFELIMLPFLPESPSYLYQTRGKFEAYNALLRLQPEKYADETLENIQQDIKDNEGSTENMTVTEVVQDRKLRKQLIVGITVQLMMQFSGIDAVFYYSSSVFARAGVSDPQLATTFLGVINVLVTIVAVQKMDSAGRKALLTYSWIGMCSSFILLTFSFACQSILPLMDQLSVVATTGVIVFFAFGPGCIAWFLIAEIFPIRARDSAMALGIFINWIANWLVAFSFPLILVHAQGYTFLIFVATTAFFLFFTKKFVPETKGQTISQVTETFDEIPLWIC